MKKYSIDPVMCYSYGTWLYHGNNRKHLTIFANRGAVLDKEQNEFAIEAVMELTRDECRSLSGDEM